MIQQKKPPEHAFKKLNWRFFSNKDDYRRLQDRIFTALCVFMCTLVVITLVSMLATLITKGLPGISWSIFTKITLPEGKNGGLANAIFGSLLITSIGVFIAVPLGVLIATYLAEEEPTSVFAKIVRLLNDTLLSAPSIIIGLFVYTTVVKCMGHFSAFAGAIALALIALPMMIRSVEDVLSLLPRQLRESAVAMGLPNWKITLFIVYKAARTGIFTAILLSIARMLGETAPLLFTTMSNQFWNSDVFQPMATLPVVIYEYAMSPFSDWQSLAWSGALLISILIISMSIVTRFFLVKGKH